ncbi:MAG: tol-pal system protein YbgF [Bacteroidota bacterium]
MRLALFAVPLAVVVTGCATSPGPAPTSPAAAEAERTVLDLRAKNAAAVRRIEELENRIFILEDQLDSRNLAAEQRAPATLPARPPIGDGAAGGAAGAVAPSDDRAGTIQTTIVAEHAVDYTGEAVQGAGPMSTESTALWAEGSGRPQLRLSANRSQVTARGNTVPRTTPDALREYRGALESLRAGRPQEALAAFDQFLQTNPQHDYADNAQYWIGECHYDQRHLRAAEQAFRRVVERYPRGNKVPDAMLKLGFTMQGLGDEAGGRAVLESLTRAFPKHGAARMASARLAHPEPDPRLRDAGGPRAAGGRTP